VLNIYFDSSFSSVRHEPKYQSVRHGSNARPVHLIRTLGKFDNPILTRSSRSRLPFFNDCNLVLPSYGTRISTLTSDQVDATLSPFHSLRWDAFRCMAKSHRVPSQPIVLSNPPMVKEAVRTKRLLGDRDIPISPPENTRWVARNSQTACLAIGSLGTHLRTTGFDG